MKYLKDILRISIFVAIMYVPLAWYSTVGTLHDVETRNNIQTVEKIRDFRTKLDQFLMNDRVLESCQMLKAAKEAGSLVSYRLESKDITCANPDSFTQLPPIEIAKPTSLLFFDQPQLFLRGETRQSQWAIAVANPEQGNLWSRIKSDGVLREGIYKDLALVIYIIFAFIFCAVLILAESIQNQYRKRGKDPLWLKIINATFGRLQLHDLKIIKAASAVLIKKNEELTKDKDLLETSLEYSILNEIRESNHKIPYQFYGTVAKVDINGFSKIVSAGFAGTSHNLTRFLEDFGCELLLRYNGLFEKTVGDEIVVVFKSENSQKLAVAFARDLMTEFSKLSFDFGDEKRSFTLKSAINSSDILFSKRAPGYGFTGDALTYASRLLDMVTQKDRNFLSFLETEASAVAELMVLKEGPKKFEFKNMSANSGYLVDQFVSVQDAYEKAPHLMPYFRSDAAFSFYLAQIQKELDLQKIDRVLNCFRLGTIRVCSEELIVKWIETLKILESRVVQNKDFAVVFSKLISEGARLIPRAQWSARCTDAILAIPRNLDGRINASIIDVLIDKDLNSIAIENEKSFIIQWDSSFRTRGNLLINQALYQLSNSVFDKITSMVLSSKQLESNTGIFCACTVILHYQKINPAELETYSSYRKLVQALLRVQEKEILLSPRINDLLKRTLSQIDTNASVAS